MGMPRAAIRVPKVWRRSWKQCDSSSRAAANALRIRVRSDFGRSSCPSSGSGNTSASSSRLDRHVANAQAKPTPRGWRLVKSSETVQIDAVIALSMAAERACTPAARQPRILGWI